MPDIKDLSTEDRKKLLGCVSGKNTAYKEKNKVDEMPKDIAQKHFSECAKTLGLEGYEMKFEHLVEFALAEFAKVGDELKTYEIIGQKIFAAGTWTDSNGNRKTYSVADLDEMIKNFDELKSAGHLDPFLKLKHLNKKDHQLITAGPRLGDMSKLYRKGRELYADFTYVSKKIFNLIKARAYGEISAEIYRNWKNEATGKMYKLVVPAAGILGAEHPALPNLGAVWDLYSGNDEYETQEIVPEDDWSFTVGDQRALCFYTAEHTEGGVATMEDLEKLQKQIDEGVKEKTAEFESNLRTQLGIPEGTPTIEAYQKMKAEAEKNAKTIEDKEKAEFDSNLDKIFMEAKDNDQLLPVEESGFRLMLKGWQKEFEGGRVEFSYGEGKDKGTLSGNPIEAMKALLSKRPKNGVVRKESGKVDVKNKSSYKMPGDIVRDAGDLKDVQSVSGVEQMEAINAHMADHKCDFMTAYCAHFEVDKPSEPDASAYSMVGDTIEK